MPNNLRILVLGDMDVMGSGYREILSNLCLGLHDNGHEVKILGLNYNRSEHFFPFSIIPVSTFREIAAGFQNALFLWKPQIVISAIDIPQQIDFVRNLKPAVDQAGAKWIAITPLENGPLTFTWAAGLALFDRVLFISQLGCDEARKVGLKNVDHIRIGINTDLWKPATDEERQNVRKNLGFEPDDFVIITVADNQERKYLAGAMQIVGKLKRDTAPSKIKYVMVTRENNPFGYRLRDLAVRSEYGIADNIIITERGLPATELRLMYIASDVFLLTSKAEGLGMPVLEAMACGVPVVATDTGALHELLDEGRGFLIQPEYSFDDVWGNSKRDMIDIVSAAECLIYLREHPASTDLALQFARERTWANTVNDMQAAIDQVLPQPSTSAS